MEKVKARAESFSHKDLEVISALYEENFKRMREHFLIERELERLSKLARKKVKYARISVRFQSVGKRRQAKQVQKPEEIDS